MFYSNLYRRHLLDMHIDDWHPEFLSRFSPEVYVENLKKARVNYAMVYLQSHAGLCYYPTRIGTVHKRFEQEPDLIRRVIDLCHAQGIKVCGYYSLNYNTREHDKHPQWRMVQEDGKSRREKNCEGDELSFASAKQGRYGLCCPSNHDYRAFVYAQIDEILEYFDCDALFFDMPFWPHTCHCRHCRKAFGGPIPRDVERRDVIEFKARMMGEFVQSVTDHVKSRRPEMPVEHNCAQEVTGSRNSGCMEEVLAACDYAGGDLYGDLYNHSFACKFYKNATRNQPFEQMLSRCKPALRMHTLTKSRDELKTAMCSTIQHHGATLMIDAIDPVGTMDRRVYDRVGELYAFQEQYEPYFKGEMVEQVGLYYGIRSRRLGDANSTQVCCANAGKTLAQAHIPFGVTGSFHTLDGYDILAAPLLSELEDGDNQRLIDYVERGGVLYLSGCGNRELVERLTGNRFMEMTRENNLYLAPVPGYEGMFEGFNREYPLPFELSAPVVTPGSGKVLANITFPYTKPDELRFASIHSNPPGVSTEHPAVTVNRFGKGTVVWSAFPIENMQYQEYRTIFLNLLHLGGKPEYFFSSDAPERVELTAWRAEGSVTVCATALDEAVVSTPVEPFTIRVNVPAKQVRHLPDGAVIPFEVSGGGTSLRTNRLHIFDMYEIIV